MSTNIWTTFALVARAVSGETAEKLSSAFDSLNGEGGKSWRQGPTKVGDLENTPHIGLGNQRVTSED